MLQGWEVRPAGVGHPVKSGKSAHAELEDKDKGAFKAHAEALFADVL